jgi:hypothetical protein
MSDKSPGPSAVTALPLVFQVAFAPTVRQSSANRTFNIKTLADMIGGYPPVGQEVATALIEKHGLIQGTLEIKKLGPAIYFGRYPDNARTRTGQNLEACTAIILDFDGRAGDRVHRDQLLVACREHNLQVLIHDSFSADDSGTTYRAIFPCNELAIDCYASAAMALKQLLGVGPKTILPPSQGYFFQARPGRKPNVQALFGRSVDQVLDFDSLEAIADGVAPVGQSQSGSYDLLDAMDHAFDDAGKELFARCLTAVEPWSEDRGHWISIVGAGLRGWGLTPQKLANLNTLTEQEQGIITRLDAWSKNEHPPTGALKKYSPNCVVIEGRKLFSLAAKKLGLAGMVRKAHESSPEGIGALLEGEPILMALAERLLGQKPPPGATTHVDPSELAEAITERQASKQKTMALAERQARVIHNMPTAFGRMRDIVIEFATRGDIKSFNDLSPDYEFKLDPIMAILSVAQMYSVILGGRVWVHQRKRHDPTGLNLYVLAIAASGSGKTTRLDWIKRIMRLTPYDESVIGNMSFSIGGFWPATYERAGHNVLQLTDEGKNLIDTHVGNIGANLATLHTSLLTAYSQSHEGGVLNPPLYSTGGKVINNGFSDVLEPHLNIHAIGTAELTEIVAKPEFLANGFSARFIVRIEPETEPPTKESRMKHIGESSFDDFEEIVGGEEGNVLGLAASDFAEHLRELDTQLEALNRGRGMSGMLAEIELMAGDEEDLAFNYKKAAKECQAVPRTNQYIGFGDAVVDVLADAETFFDPYVKENALLDSVRMREVEKLTKLAAIFTLGRDPSAKRIDPEITRYLMEVIQLAQLDWITKRNDGPPVNARWANDMPALRREVEPGGKLFECQNVEGVPRRELEASNRAWRRLIADTMLSDDDLKGKRSVAKDVMGDLGVTAEKIGNGMFYKLVKR